MNWFSDYSVSSRIKELLDKNEAWQLVICVNYHSSAYFPNWIIRLEDCAMNGKVLGTYAFGNKNSLESALKEIEEIVEEKWTK